MCTQAHTPLTRLLPKVRPAVARSTHPDGVGQSRPTAVCGSYAARRDALGRAATAPVTPHARLVAVIVSPALAATAGGRSGVRCGATVDAVPAKSDGVESWASGDASNPLGAVVSLAAGRGGRGWSFGRGDIVGPARRGLCRAEVKVRGLGVRSHERARRRPPMAGDGSGARPPSLLRSTVVPAARASDRPRHDEGSER